jgi:ribonucleoside-diphosphate reductase alpha chain
MDHCKLPSTFGAEQPLPPNGACLLGSFNLVKYIEWEGSHYVLKLNKLIEDIPEVVRAMDNIVDRAIYPLEAQYLEATSKRRMGLGFTGVANALEALGYPYGSPNFLETLNMILQVFTNEVYRASALLAQEKGAFPLYDNVRYLNSNFIAKLDDDVKDLIGVYGIRNSHLTSIAPTGTISITADNISSGIEPVFSYGFDRTIQTATGPRTERIDDYGLRTFGVRGKTADSLDPQEHLAVLAVASFWMDSAVSKTCNVGDAVSFDDFKDIYIRAWRMQAKGCTTFRAAGKRMGILVAAPQEGEGAACYIDENGKKTCDQ